MSLFSTNKGCSNSAVKFIILSSLVLYGVAIIILSPIYVITQSNIIYSTTILPFFLKIFIDLLFIIAYAAGFSAIIYSVSTKGAKESKLPLLTYCAALFLRHVLNLSVQALLENALPTGSDVIYVVINLLLDVLMSLAVFLIARAVFKKTEKKQDTAIKRLFNFSNPIQVATFLVAILLSLTKILTRAIYDITIGPPSDIIDLLWMIVYYTSDILVGLITYLLELFFISHLKK